MRYHADNTVGTALAVGTSATERPRVTGSPPMTHPFLSDRFGDSGDHRSRPWARVHCHRSAKAVQMLPLLVLSEAVLVLVIVIEAVRRWRFGNAFNRDSQSGQPRHDPLRRDHRRTWVPTVVPTWVQDRVTSSEVRIPGYTSRQRSTPPTSRRWLAA